MEKVWFVYIKALAQETMLGQQRWYPPLLQLQSESTVAVGRLAQGVAQLEGVALWEEVCHCGGRL